MCVELSLSFGFTDSVFSRYKVMLDSCGIQIRIEYILIDLFQLNGAYFKAVKKDGEFKFPDCIDREDFFFYGVPVKIYLHPAYEIYYSMNIDQEKAATLLF